MDVIANYIELAGKRHKDLGLDDQSLIECVAYGKNQLYLVHRPKSVSNKVSLTTLFVPDEEQLLKQGFGKSNPQDEVIDAIVQQYFLTGNISSDFRTINLNGFVPLQIGSVTEMNFSSEDLAQRKYGEIFEVYSKENDIALCYTIQTPFAEMVLGNQSFETKNFDITIPAIIFLK